MIAKAKSSGPMKAASYIRMSSDQQTDSPAQQREYVTVIAERESCEVVKEYCDEGKSGASIKGRPQFQKLLADAKAGKFEAVIIWDLNRLSREDSLDASEYVNTLRKAGVRVFTQRGEIDLQTSMGRLMYSMEQEGANDYLVKLSAATTRGKIRRAKTGTPMTRAPYGYVRLLYDERGQLMRRVAHNEFFSRPKTWTTKFSPAEDGTAEVVQSIYEDVARHGYSIQRIVGDLNRRKIPSPGGKLWSTYTVTQILKCRTYAGDFYYGLSTVGKFSEVGSDGTISKATGERKAEPAILVRDAHPAIIDRKTFDRVQAKLQERKRRKERRRSSPYILTGMLRCGKCGGPMAGKGDSRTSTTGRSYYVGYYCCELHATQLTCGAQRIPSQLAEEKLIELAQSMLDVRAIEAAIERRASSVRPEKPKAETRRLERRLATLETDIRAAISNMLRLSSPADVAEAQSILESWRAEQADLQKQLETLPDDHLRLATVLTEAKRTAKQIKQAITSEDREAVRNALRTLFESVTVYWQKREGHKHRPSRMIAKFSPLGIVKENVATVIELPECLSPDDKALAALRTLFKGRPLGSKAIATHMGVNDFVVRHHLRKAVRSGIVKSSRKGYWLVS